MRNDWRTDNWGGYRDVGRDPNNYHFAKDLKRHGHDPYAQYNRYLFEQDAQISIWTLAWIVVAILGSRSLEKYSLGNPIFRPSIESFSVNM